MSGKNEKWVVFLFEYIFKVALKRQRVSFDGRIIVFLFEYIFKVV